MSNVIKIQAGANAGPSDCSLTIVNQGYLPILSLTDTFVNRNTIRRMSVVIEDSINTIYKNDSNGVNALTFLGSVTSYKKTRNNLFYNGLTKTIINIPILDDVVGSDFKFTELKTTSFSYGNSKFSSKTITDLDVPAEVINDSLALPKKLVGVSGEIITLDINGLRTLNIPTNYRIDDGGVKISNKANVIDVLVITEADLGVTDLTKHTIVTTGANTKEVTYIGNVSKNFIFIPLI